MMTTTKETWVGRGIPRVEDPRLIQGLGEYVSDIHFPGQWAMALVRSPHAHARILEVRTDAARKLSGVHAVISAVDWEDLRQPLPDMKPLSPPALAYERVLYVGQPVVAILADDRYIAEDAADLVEISYQPLTPVVNVEDARQDSVVLHPEFGTNILDYVNFVSGDGQEALKEADHVISATLQMGRVSAQAMEPRGIAALFDEKTQSLMVYHATQSVHRAKERISTFLQMDPDHVHVIAPEIGGGFGVKNGSYPEEVLVSYLAKYFAHPIKWSGDRFEEFLGTYQEREQTHHVQLGIKNDGRIVAFVDTYYQDNGAYPGGGVLVAHNTARNLMGPYRIPHFAIHCYTVMTNKVPQTPYRGAGRPQGHYIIERIMDRAADELGMDRIAIRMKNLVRPQDFPYATGFPGVVYDSGDYPQTFQDLLDIVDVSAFRVRQQQARAQGIRLGLGLANYVEISAGFGFEGVHFRLAADGRIELATGATGQGQGHRTALAQIAADTFEMPLEQIAVVEGDTRRIDKGIGTFGSRTVIMAGNAIVIGGQEFLEKAREAAAKILDVKTTDVVYHQGTFSAPGTSAKSLDWTLLASELQRASHSMPAHEYYFYSNTATYGFGCHGVIVEVNEKTSEIRIPRYVVVHDGGVVVNPLLANGQVIGGVVQGLGSALYEEMRFNENGQPITTSFLAYHLPGAVSVPDIEIHHRNYRAPGNPGGYKGVGEAGIIPSQAVILSAVEDAFRDQGLRLNYAPITPGRLFHAMHREEAKL